MAPATTYQQHRRLQRSPPSSPSDSNSASTISTTPITTPSTTGSEIYEVTEEGLPQVSPKSAARRPIEGRGTTTLPPPPSPEPDEGTLAGGVKEIVKESAKVVGVNPWTMYAILFALILVIVGICFLCVRRCFRKRRTKDGKKGGKGAVDLKSVQLLGNASKEKVQPDMEELTENAEEEEDKPEVVKLGKLKYKLEYDFNANNLSVTVLQAEELPALDMGGTSDPYVKVYLLPDKKKKFETKVHRKTLNPVFEETFVFKVRLTSA